MPLIRSEVKVAIPHFLGVKEEMNATFLTGPFPILAKTPTKRM
jgi:hypothetical protein